MSEVLQNSHPNNTGFSTFQTVSLELIVSASQSEEEKKESLIGFFSRLNEIMYDPNISVLETRMRYDLTLEATNLVIEAAKC